MTHPFWQSLFLFILAIIFAGLEIESEGKDGWAFKMPTWYRTEGMIAKIYGLIMAGKPLTGYHSFMFFLPIIIFHFPFFMETDWTLANELLCWALYFSFAPVWDYLWFVLNPHYGVKNFKKENVWWHSKSIWLFNIIPLDYLIGLIVSTGFAMAAGLIDKNTPHITNQVDRLVYLILLILVAIFLSRYYHNWYYKMREKDDRDKINDIKETS
jgi:hypothetical protein